MMGCTACRQLLVGHLVAAIITTISKILVNETQPARWRKPVHSPHIPTLSETQGVGSSEEGGGGGTPENILCIESV